MYFQGDSGGPLVCEKDELPLLVGLVSWGIECAIPGIPGAYANVPTFVSEIECKMEVLRGKKNMEDCSLTQLTSSS